MRIVIVGGGVLGTMHAREAVARGHEVVHLEREREARGASVRNFGLIWVSGRAPGPDRDTARRARVLWEKIGAEVPGVGFRAIGSLTLCRTEAEVAVAEEATDKELLDPTAARRRNPALRGDFRAALWCPDDAAVEPRVALPAIREHLEKTGRYTWLPGREVRHVDTGRVADDRGETHGGDHVVLATGAWLSGLVRELTAELPEQPERHVRRVRLQMAQTAPLDEPLTTAVADADSFRYYPAYAGPAREALEDQAAVAKEHKMQLLLVQRRDGGLTIGDTHEYDEPFGFDVVEEPYDHLVETASALLGRPLPRVTRRWAGVYAQCLDPAAVLHRQRVADGVWLVTGPGGRGMTGSPAMAETTAEELSW